MSQNFELLRQLEAEVRFAEAILEEPVVAQPDELGNHEFSHELLALAQTLFLSGEKNAPHSIVLCGIDRENASSEICVKLGRVLAALSASPVCLVDAHLRSPRLDKVLRAHQFIPISDRSEIDCREISPNLWLGQLTLTGDPKQLGLAAASDLKQQVAELQQRFGFVLIDTPGVNTYEEAPVLGQFVDGVILIIEANVTRKVAALKARQALEDMNVRILGSVLNNRVFPIPEGLYRKL
ncbi:MAG TPA: hypothetical protein VMD97_11335 [Candidatus Aquilonibacter sp.]|nr:hypothetical protein [Candidatus Aquilonibacter sp.]